MKNTCKKCGKEIEKSKSGLCRKCFLSEPEMVKKRTEAYKKHCQEKYGVDFYLSTKEKQEKSKKTCLERYGVDYVSKLKAAQEKSK